MSKKYTIKSCTGYWLDEPTIIFRGAQVALEEWDGVEDHEDESIFYYMDNEPLEIGTIIACNFIVTEIT